MKRLIPLTLSLLFLAACGTDDDGNGGGDTGYVTDDLRLKEQKNALLIMSHDPKNPATINFEIFRLIMEDAFKDELTSMSLVDDEDSPLHGEMVDTLFQVLGLDDSPAFFLNNEPYMLSGSLLEPIEIALMEMPLASIEHKVNKRDTAWVIDSKIKFWKDTSNAEIRIESYMLGHVEAANYDSKGIDLRSAGMKDIVNEGDSLSSWITSVPNADSSATLISPGTKYRHRFILLDKYYDENLFGTPLSEYTPFWQAVFENDVVGTRSTPIQHSFRRPNFKDADDPTFEFEFQPVFLSVIWMKNPMTGSFEYINSTMTVSSN